jgi:hypothetical protein
LNAECNCCVSMIFGAAMVMQRIRLWDLDAPQFPL